MCQERVGANLMFAHRTLGTKALFVRGRTQGSPLHRAGT